MRFNLLLHRFLIIYSVVISCLYLNALAQSPYKVMPQSPMHYSGVEPASRYSNSEIRIGMLAPDDNDDPIARPMMQGAKLAIEEANQFLRSQHANHKIKTVTLINRWTDDPWKSGRDVTQLIYIDKVNILIGSIDGDATHILEQIAVKARIPVLSPVATNTSLMHVPIPWLFQLPPSDAVQSKVLYEQVLKNYHDKRIGLIYSSRNDDRMMRQDLLTVLGEHTIHPNFQLCVDRDELNVTDAVHQIQSFDPEILVIILSNGMMQELLTQFTLQNISVPVCLKWQPGLPMQELNQHYPNLIYTIDPITKKENTKQLKFIEKYSQLYQEKPTPVSYFTYDAIDVSVHAIIKSIASKTSLLEEIRNMEGTIGVSRIISWDVSRDNAYKNKIRVIHNE